MGKVVVMSDTSGVRVGVRIGAVNEAGVKPRARVRVISLGLE